MIGLTAKDSWLFVVGNMTNFAIAESWRDELGEFCEYQALDSGWKRWIFASIDVFVELWLENGRFVSWKSKLLTLFLDRIRLYHCLYNALSFFLSRSSDWSLVWICNKEFDIHKRQYGPVLYSNAVRIFKILFYKKIIENIHLNVSDFSWFSLDQYQWM